MKNNTKKHTLKHALNQKIKNTPKIKLLKILKYNNEKIAFKTIDKFLETKDTYEWLNNGHYDFKYTSEGFLSQLYVEFELYTPEFDLEINEAKKKIKYLTEYNKSNFYIKVQTKWVRDGESITILALVGNSLSYISVNKEELYGLSEEKELELVKEKILSFNDKHKGVVPIFGKIEYFKYNSNYGKTKRIIVNEKNEIEILSNTSISLEFYFNIIENYSYSFKEVFQVDKYTLASQLDLFKNKKIILYDLLINLFREYLQSKYYIEILTNKEKEREIKSFIGRVYNLIGKRFNFIFHTLKQQLLEEYLD